MYVNPDTCFLLLCQHVFNPFYAAEGGESDGGDETKPERLTESAGPPEDDNEIFGGRTNAHKHCLQEKGPCTNPVLPSTLLKEPVAIKMFNEGKTANGVNAIVEQPVNSRIHL